MLTNITLGQYYPVDSRVHRLDPRTKLVLTIVFIVVVLKKNNWAFLHRIPIECYHPFSNNSCFNRIIQKNRSHTCY